MHLFIELITLVFFLLTVAHGVARRREDGVWLFGSLFFLGFVRENFVVLRDYLYGFAPLNLMGGKAPLIASIIWGYTIYIAICFAEGMTGESLDDRRPSVRFYVFTGLFMVATVGFYEPFLELIGMARWEDGTRATGGVPWIALIGYPSLTLPFLALWCWSMRTGRGVAPRAVRIVLLIGTLALVHAAGLQALKDGLNW